MAEGRQDDQEVIGRTAFRSVPVSITGYESRMAVESPVPDLWVEIARFLPAHPLSAFARRGPCVRLGARLSSETGSIVQRLARRERARVPLTRSQMR
jgi:hypothetical protein